jgi:hypothetical protein
VDPSSTAEPQSFEARISQIRLWPLPLVVLCTGLAVTTSARVFSVPQVAVGRTLALVIYASPLAWWLWKVAPRPYSVRATFGRRRPTTAPFARRPDPRAPGGHDRAASRRLRGPAR